MASNIIKTTVEAAVADAFSAAQALGEECREQFDNMPEGFQNGDRGQIINEAADALEYLDEPTVPDIAKDTEVVYTASSKKRPTRQDRLDEARNMLDSAMAAVQQVLDDEDPEDKYAEEDHEAMEQLVSDLQELIDTLDGVSFT